jgi:hypothetical protein
MYLRLVYPSHSCRGIQAAETADKNVRRAWHHLRSKEVNFYENWKMKNVNKYVLIWGELKWECALSTSEKYVLCIVQEMKTILIKYATTFFTFLQHHKRRRERNVTARELRLFFSPRRLFRIWNLILSLLQGSRCQAGKQASCFLFLKTKTRAKPSLKSYASDSTPKATKVF